MIAEFFNSLTTSGSAFVDFLVKAIQSIWAIFYTPAGENGGGGFTSIGLFMIVGLSIGIVYGLIRWVTKLIHLRG